MDQQDLRAWTNSLRVAVVHSFYSSRQSSGENRVVEQQVAALRRAGIAVFLTEQRTDDREQSRWYPLEAAATVATGRGRSPLADLHDFQPDVVHVHNLFPNFGRAWVRDWSGPIVATTHNFRPLCPAATFYRDGRTCTDCLDRRSARPAVQHGCYRGSRVQTLPLVVGTRFGADPLLARADRVVVLNDTMRDLYQRAGVAGERMVTVPNFLPDPGQPGGGGDHWLYVGRLSPEKGIVELVREWPADRRLLVVGDGPLRDEVAAAAPSGVTLLGEQPAERVGELMRQARGLVFPSRCFEGAPMVYVEALAAGTPVLAWRPSSVADAVTSEGTGLVVGHLPVDLDRAEAEFPAMRAQCRVVFEQRYTEDAWLDAMRSVYDGAMVARGGYRARA